MTKHESLNGKVAVITGGGGVLCSGFAKTLAEQGVKVAAYPCDYTLNPQGKFNPRWLVPQLQAFDVTCMALHEYVGMAGAFLQR